MSPEWTSQENTRMTEPRVYYHRTSGLPSWRGRRPGHTTTASSPGRNVRSSGRDSRSFCSPTGAPDSRGENLVLSYIVIQMSTGSTLEQTTVYPLLIPHRVSYPKPRSDGPEPGVGVNERNLEARKFRAKETQSKTSRHSTSIVMTRRGPSNVLVTRRLSLKNLVTTVTRVTTTNELSSSTPVLLLSVSKLRINLK